VSIASARYISAIRVREKMERGSRKKEGER
jgi:hypothetical protein